MFYIYYIKDKKPVVESDIHHPTDTGLLNDGIRVTRVVSKLKKVIPGIGSRFVVHTRKAKKVYLGLMKVIKGRTGQDDTSLKKARGKLVKITEGVIASGRAELELFQEKPPLVNRLRGQLGEWIEVAEKVVRQTKEVIKGNRHLPQRLVSLFDAGARPIKRGKSRTDTEFGRKVFLGETDHGIITTYDVLEENPADTALLKTAVRGHRRLFRKRLKAIAGDRGLYSQANEDWLKNGGDSLMLQRLLGHTTLMMTNRYCQAVGCYDAIESHKKYSPVDNLGRG